MPTPIMDKLTEARVVHLHVDNEEINTGVVEIMEACDSYFTCSLTKAEYIALAPDNE